MPISALTVGIPQGGRCLPEVVAVTRQFQEVNVWPEIWDDCRKELRGHWFRGYDKSAGKVLERVFDAERKVCRLKPSENFPTLRWITRQIGMQFLIASSPWQNLGEPKRQVRMMPKASRNAQSISPSTIGRAFCRFRSPNACDEIAEARARQLPAVPTSPSESSIDRTRMEWRSQADVTCKRPPMRLSGLPACRAPIHAVRRAAIQRKTDTFNTRRGAHRPIPCEPPSSAELSGEVGEHCLSEA